VLRGIRRFLIFALTAICLAATALVAWFLLSPWPSVLLISMAFAGNDAASEDALEKHVPPGIAVQNDLRYGDGPDEVFDLARPGGHDGALPLVVWVHGGGFIGGSKDGVANYLKILASNGFAVAGVNYSTAPGSNYPTPVRQVGSALEFLTANSIELGIDPSRIILAGDSAGAQIAAQAAIIIVDANYAASVGISPTVEPQQLRGTILVSGAFDLTGLDVQGGVAGWFVKTVLWSYSGVRDFMHDEEFGKASITPNVGAHFPPTFITSGDEDPLEPQAGPGRKAQRSWSGDDKLIFCRRHGPPTRVSVQSRYCSRASGLRPARGLRKAARPLRTLVRLYSCSPALEKAPKPAVTTTCVKAPRGEEG